MVEANGSLGARPSAFNIVHVSIQFTYIYIQYIYISLMQ